MPTLADMTSSQLHYHFRTKAEEAEAKAVRRKKRIYDEEFLRLEVRWRTQKKFHQPRQFEIELDMIVASACGKDPVWKSAVADNQWMMQKAMMYGQSALIEAQSAVLSELMRLNG